MTTQEAPDEPQNDAQPRSADWPEYWSAAAIDAAENVLQLRPELAGSEFAQLVEVGELLTSASALDDEIRVHGVTATTDKGQTTVSPLVKESRLLRTSAATILARLTPADLRTFSQRQRDNVNRRHRSRAA